MNETPEVESTERPTILIVDDDPMIRRLVARGLGPLQPENVLEAGDGVAAQKILLEHRIDIVITDVLMPNMDGRELMKWALEHCPGPLWIVLSGLDTFDAAVDALHVGAFDFIPKPPEVQRLRLIVRNAMDQIKLAGDRERLYRDLQQSNLLLRDKVDQLENLCRMLEDQAEVIHADLERAEVIQRALLPQAPPALGCWSVDTLYRPGANVGGDFYDIAPLDRDHIGVVLADSAGHGVAAAMLSVLVKHRLKMVDDDTHALLAPQVVLENLNRSLLADVSAPGVFVTAIYVLLDKRSGRLRIASAGHPPGIWARRGREAIWVQRSGPALGLDADALYGETAVELDPGDRFLLFTDGLLDGRPSAATRDELAAALLDSSTDGGDLLRNLHGKATRDASADQDDITIILLERSEGSSRFDHGEQPQQHPEHQEPAAVEVQIRSGQSGGMGFLSIAGSATWVRSQVFYETALGMLKRGEPLTIDLGACEYLDSTFLGTLHEIVATDPESVRLQRATPPVRALFDELSMTKVLERISPTPLPLPSAMETLEHATKDESRERQRMLRAHEVLASLSKENLEQFDLVIKTLRK